MNKSYRFYADPIKALGCGLTCLLCLVVAAILAVSDRLVGSIVFATIFLVFLYNGLCYAAVVVLDQTGITQKVAGLTARTKTWGEIAEVSVCGTRVFLSSESKRTGTLYLCFFEKQMSEKEKFDVILRWPPRKTIYMQYDVKRVQAVQMLWAQTITTYNAGKLVVGEAPME